MALNIFGNGIWGGGQQNNNSSTTTSTGTGPIGVSGSPGGNIGGGGSGGNIGHWGISGSTGQATPQFVNSQPIINLKVRCKRCGYKENEHSDRYCILCNEEITI